MQIWKKKSKMDVQKCTYNGRTKMYVQIPKKGGKIAVFVKKVTKHVTFERKGDRKVRTKIAHFGLKIG